MLFRFISIIFICSFSASSKYLQAQNFVELNSGYSYNNIITNIKTNNFTQINKQKGYYFSVFYNRRYFDRLYFKIGVESIQKNYLMQRKDNFYGIYELHRNIYIQLPLIIQLKITEIKNVSFFLNTGIYGGYWISNKTDGSIPNAFDSSYDVNTNGEIYQSFYFTKYKMRNEFNSIKDNRIELGIKGGGQLEYPISKLFSLTLGINYSYPFTDQQKKYMKYQILQRNQTLLVTIGTIFKIDNEKF